MNFNTLFQLYYMCKYKKAEIERADRLLFILELLGDIIMLGTKLGKLTDDICEELGTNKATISHSMT